MVISSAQCELYAEREMLTKYVCKGLLLRICFEVKSFRDYLEIMKTGTFLYGCASVLFMTGNHKECATCLWLSDRRKLVLVIMDYFKNWIVGGDNEKSRSV